MRTRHPDADPLTSPHQSAPSPRESASSHRLKFTRKYSSLGRFQSDSPTSPHLNFPRCGPLGLPPIRGVRSPSGFGTEPSSLNPLVNPLADRARAARSVAYIGA